jgi:excinuclease ABC subunit C
MRMCLAPCFQGCTDDEYRLEAGRVIAFLDSEGQSLIRVLETERAQASDALDFEQAAKLHRKLEKVHEVLRLKPGLARNLAELNALVLQRGAEPNSILFFRVRSGELQAPVALSLDQQVSSPVPLDEQIRKLLEGGEPEERFALPPAGEVLPSQVSVTTRGPALPSWEHLSLLARWYYSSFREGELVMLPGAQEIPHARLIRLCRRMLAPEWKDEKQKAEPRVEG